MVKHRQLSWHYYWISFCQSAFRESGIDIRWFGISVKQVYDPKNDHVILCVSDGSCISAMDYPGRDTSPTPLLTSSPENCQILCQNFPGCQFFRFVTNDNNCYLKYEKSTEIASTTGFSGPSFCSSNHGKSKTQNCGRVALHAAV